MKILLKILLIISLSTNLVAQEITFFKDLNPTSSSYPYQLVKLGSDKYLFSAYTDTEGRELWISDGTTGNTKLVLDINPGTNSSSPGSFVALGSKVVFSAEGTEGNEPYVTDGTLAGTSLLSVINSGSSSSNPQFLFIKESNLYFLASDGVGPSTTQLYKTNGEDVTAIGYITTSQDSLSYVDSKNAIYSSKKSTGYFPLSSTSDGFEIIKTDGTLTGTAVATDLGTGVDSSLCDSSLVFYDEKYIFFCGTSSTGDSELYKYYIEDGKSYLVEDINIAGSSNPYPMVSTDDFVFFTAERPSTGRQLYVYKGESGSIKRLSGAGFNINFTGISQNNFIEFDNKLIFVATTAEHGTEIFITDGTSEGTKLLSDINSGTGGSDPYNFTVYEDGVYFIAYGGATVGYELYRTDGTVSGTTITKELNQGSGDSLSNILGVFEKKLWLSASSTSSDYELHNYRDLCAVDTAKIEPGDCGCGIKERDLNNDGLNSCGGILTQTNQVSGESTRLQFPFGKRRTAAYNAQLVRLNARVNELLSYLRINRSSISMKSGKSLNKNISRIKSAMSKVIKAKSRKSLKDSKRTLNLALKRLRNELASDLNI